MPETTSTSKAALSSTSNLSSPSSSYKMASTQFSEAVEAAAMTSSTTAYSIPIASSSHFYLSLSPFIICPRATFNYAIFRRSSILFRSRRLLQFLLQRLHQAWPSHLVSHMTDIQRPATRTGNLHVTRVRHRSPAIFQP